MLSWLSLYRKIYQLSIFISTVTNFYGLEKRTNATEEIAVGKPKSLKEISTFMFYLFMSLIKKRGWRGNIKEIRRLV